MEAGCLRWAPRPALPRPFLVWPVAGGVDHPKDRDDLRSPRRVSASDDVPVTPLPTSRRFLRPGPAGRSAFRRGVTGGAQAIGGACAAAGFSAAMKAIWAFRSSSASRDHSTARVTAPAPGRKSSPAAQDTLRQPGRRPFRDQPREIGAEGAAGGGKAELLGQGFAVDRGGYRPASTASMRPAPPAPTALRTTDRRAPRCSAEGPPSPAAARPASFTNQVPPTPAPR